MNPDQWAIKNGISLEPIAGIAPMERIKWAVQLLGGTITQVFDGPYQYKSVK